LQFSPTHAGVRSRTHRFAQNLFPSCLGRPKGSGLSREKLLKKYSGLAKDLEVNYLCENAFQFMNKVKI
jgi:hypothetical protein